MSDEREYKLFFQKTDPDPLGFYKADFVGKGNGHISTGAIVFSNTTTGLGNLTGYIHPQKVAVFQLVGDQNVFVSTDGCQMTFQNIIGKNDLTYIQGFIEYILQRKLQSIQGDEYQGIEKKKAYIVTYTRDDGQTARATMTNFGFKDFFKGSTYKKAGKAIADTSTNVGKTIGSGSKNLGKSIASKTKPAWTKVYDPSSGKLFAKVPVKRTKPVPAPAPSQPQFTQAQIDASATSGRIAGTADQYSADTGGPSDTYFNQLYPGAVDQQAFVNAYNEAALAQYNKDVEAYNAAQAQS